MDRFQNIFKERDERSGRIVKQTSPTLPRGVVLPAGWESARSPSGRTYFFHRSSGRSQWNPPLTRESRTPVSRTTSRPPPPSRLGTIADAVLDRRSQNRDMNTKTSERTNDVFFCFRFFYIRAISLNYDDVPLVFA